MANSRSPSMHIFPSFSRDEASWQEWCSNLRPTTLVSASVDDISLPLRVFCCETMIDTYTVKLIKPQDWNFATISHRWLRNEPWTAIRQRPYPAAGGMDVTAVKKKSLLALSSLCISIGIKYFWLDCLCIDQQSRLEQAREILNMGLYYSRSCKTLIFPYGLDIVGPPLLADGGVPVWHERAWTLQEEALAGGKAIFVLYLGGEDYGVEAHEAMAMSANSTHDGNEQSFEWFAVTTSGMRHKYPDSKRYLHLVPASKMTSCRAKYLENDALFGNNPDARTRGLTALSVMESQKTWTLWSALREMYRRDAAMEEDLVYGLLGLLGVSLPPESIRYGIHLRGALQLLVDAVHVDQRLLLTVVESYHGNFIDGFCTLPAFRDPTAVPAARMTHLRTLGTATFSGHSGMLITSPSISVDLVPKVDDSTALSLEMDIPEQVLVDMLEDSGAMDLYGFNQTLPSTAYSSQGLVKMASGTLTRGVTLVAVTQVEAPVDDIFRKRDGSGRMVFCCLVCSDGGSVKHKVGIALVNASSHEWKVQRHLVA